MSFIINPLTGKQDYYKEGLQIFKGTTSTTSTTATKVIENSDFIFEAGNILEVRFNEVSTTLSMVLSIDSKVKNVKHFDGTALSANRPAYCPANKPIRFLYDGTDFLLIKEEVDSYHNIRSGYKIDSDGFKFQYGTGVGGDNMYGGNIPTALLTNVIDVTTLRVIACISFPTATENNAGGYFCNTLAYTNSSFKTQAGYDAGAGSVYYGYNIAWEATGY